MPTTTAGEPTESVQAVAWIGRGSARGPRPARRGVADYARALSSRATRSSIAGASLALAKRAILAVGLLVLAAGGAWGQTSAPVQDPNDLKKLSLEELLELEVTSVSRKPEKLSETAAAVHVVTGEDIRRSGAPSIPEALRGIPGVEVGRVDSRQYAITARGFNGTVANKLLVMIDGRSVYTPLFSGVFWDVQDVFMDDVDRIEVIRGPGATVWGANAVNGIVNVLTKSAEETQGFLVTGGGGDEERGFGGVRYGGPLGSAGHFRVYAKYFSRDDAALPGGEEAGDEFRMGQGGFRMDWEAASSDRFTLQGDLYDGGAEQPSADDVELAGGNLLARWTRTFSEGSDLGLRAYYDVTDREQLPTFAERLHTYDLDVKHRFSPGARQEIVWGLGYRRTHDDVDNSPALAFLPERLTQALYTGFVQDEIRVVPERFRVTVGTKIEHHDYSGYEYQPSLRLTWTPRDTDTVWAVASRAVRAPSRIDRDLFAPAIPPFFLEGGGRRYDSEILHAYELGYRVEPAASLTASIATFYNVYDDLRSLEAGPPAFLSNGLEGKSYGVELEAAWQALRGWRLDLGYSFLQLNLRAKPGSTDTTQVDQEGDSPRHQVFFRSLADLPHGIEIDVAARYVDDLPNQEVDAYTSVDVRVGWRAGERLDVSVAGRNLIDSAHAEFGDPSSREEIERSVHGMVRWRF